MRFSNRTCRPIGLALLALLSAAGASWACTYQPNVLGLSVQSGPPGSQVTVEGKGMDSGGPVDLRWNGAQGQILAQAVPDGEGNFALVATIPEVDAGVYSIMVTDGTRGTARSAFEVTSEAPDSQSEEALPAKGFQEGSPELWAGFSSQAPGGITAPSASGAQAATSKVGLGAGVGMLAVGFTALLFGMGAQYHRRIRSKMS